jgi:serine/threonine protein kinase
MLFSFYYIISKNDCNVARFEICRKLGQGTYGKVQLGINKETGQKVSRAHARF